MHCSWREWGVVHFTCTHSVHPKTRETPGIRSVPTYGSVRMADSVSLADHRRVGHPRRIKVFDRMKLGEWIDSVHIP